MAGRGGRRPGAGRKPKAVKHETAIQSAERRICDRLPELIDKLFELSMGVLVEGQMPQGMVVYQQPPSFKALEYLVNRVMGRPTERHEHDFSNLSDEELIARTTAALGRDGQAGAHPSA